MNEQKKTFTSGQTLGLMVLIMGEARTDQKESQNEFRFSIDTKVTNNEQRNLNMNYLQRIIATMKEKKITMRETEKESEKIRNLERF